jgi:hypothetical protein
VSVINTLEVKINGNTADLEKKLRSSATSVAKWGAASVAAAAAAGAALVKAGLSSADAMAKQARQLGATSDELTKLTRAGDMAGVSQGQLNTALRGLNTRLGQATQGTGTAVDSLQRLGLTADQVARMPLPERIAAINQALKDNVPAAERAAVAAGLFGERGGQAMAQISPDVIAEAADQVNRLGGSLSDVQAAQIEAANDAMSQMGVLTTGVSQRLAAQFAPALEGIANLFFDAAKESDGFADAVTKAYDHAITGAAFVLDAVDGIKRVFELTADGIIAAMAMVAKEIAESIAWVLEKVSKLPGVDYSDTVDSLREFGATAGAIVDSAMDNISDTLDRPFAGEAFKQFVAEAEAASRAAAEAAVRAQSGGIEFGEAGESPEIAARREAMEKRLKVLQEGLMSEMELEQVRHEERMEALREALDLEMITRQEFMDMTEEYTLNHEDRITQMQQEAADKRLALAKAEADAKMNIMRSALGNMANLMNTSSKKAFEIGKKAAIAQAAIDGGKAIQSAWAAGMSTGGPWAPAIAAGYAATAAITSANQINNIRSQSFGGGGGSPAPAGQGSSGIAAPGGGGGGPAGGTLTVQGLDAGTLLTGDVVGQIAQDLLDYQRRGGQVVLA